MDKTKEDRTPDKRISKPEDRPEDESEVKSRTILFALLNGSENLESCLRLADIMKEKGFKVVIALDKNSVQSPFIIASDHQKEIYDCQPLPDRTKQTSDLDLNSLDASIEDKLKNVCQHLVLEKFEFVRRCEPLNEELIQRFKPEMIIVESLVCSPALTNSGIPWVWLNFGPANLCKNDNRIPPGWSGLSYQKYNEFSAFKEKWNKVFNGLKFRINSWCVSKGTPELTDTRFHPQSPYLNLYVHPTELDYKLVNSWELKDWLQLDCLLDRKAPKKFPIPLSIASKPGRVVYLNMGPFASLELLRRLVALLSESANKFIVSKGPFHRQYELADNMWGEEDVPLNDVIRSVDLVITCGDTKTIFECFQNARPLIALPLFGEQLDNRMRLRECGFGWGLDPFTCTKETLLCMIESLMDDKPLMRRLLNIANSMERNNSAKKAAEEIEKTLDKAKNQKIVANGGSREDQVIPISVLLTQVEA